MNSSFPNRWSFSYLKFTKYVTNIKEPQQKYRLGTVSIKILGGLNRFYGYPTSPSSSVIWQDYWIIGTEMWNTKQNINHTESRVSSYWSEVVTVLAWAKQNTMQRAMRTVLEWPQSHATSKTINMTTTKYEPQQKCRLGTVSKKLLGGGFNRFYGYPTSPSASIMAQNIQLFGSREGFLTHQWIITWNK